MMYGEPPQPQQVGDFHRGPPPPPLRQSSASSSTITPEYSNSRAGAPYEAHGDSYAAKRMRKLVQRRAVDYTSTVVRYLQVRLCQRDARDRTVLQPTPAAALDMLPTCAYADNPSTSFATKFVHASTNKNRCPINRVLVNPAISWIGKKKGRLIGQFSPSRVLMDALVHWSSRPPTMPSSCAASAGHAAAVLVPEAMELAVASTYGRFSCSSFCCPLRAPICLSCCLLATNYICITPFSSSWETTLPPFTHVMASAMVLLWPLCLWILRDISTWSSRCGLEFMVCMGSFCYCNSQPKEASAE